MVVLSACQSALGKMVRGEGIVGLTRAFMYAGAQSVIATLWSVADTSTAEFMKQFYTNLIIRGNSKSVALQNARLKLLQSDQFFHPFYWAPFILIGSK
jgi:CHAT domain-containing protein